MPEDTTTFQVRLVFKRWLSGIQDRYEVRLFLVHASVKAVDESGGADAKNPGNSQQCPDGNRPARLNLLPMSSGKAKSDHILLSEAAGLTEFLDAAAQCPKELTLISHPTYLENVGRDDHEQISWSTDRNGVALWWPVARA